MITGRLASAISWAARRSAARSARARGTYQVRSRNSAVGKSQASAWTSCGRASVTAPVSAGLVRVRIASSRAVGSWSGRLIRSQYLETALNASLAE